MMALVPSHPPSSERAEALAVLGQGLPLCWQFERSRAICAGTGDGECLGHPGIEIRALDVFGGDLSYLGRAEEGLGALRQARTWPKRCRPPDLFVAYVLLTDVLMMLGRLGESAEVGRRGLEVVRRFGSDATVLIANSSRRYRLRRVGRCRPAQCRCGPQHHRQLSVHAAHDPCRARGWAGRLRVRRGAPRRRPSSLREDRGLGIYDVYLAELALWERRWVDADTHVAAALTGASSPHADQLRVWSSAKGLRAVAELAALARARRDADAAVAWLAKADRLVADRPECRRHGVIDHAQRRRLAGPCRSRARPRP